MSQNLALLAMNDPLRRHLEPQGLRANDFQGDEDHVGEAFVPVSKTLTPGEV